MRSRVWLDAVGGEELRVPVPAGVVPAQRQRRHREVGPSVGHTEIAEVDVPATTAVVVDQRVGCACVAVADHQPIDRRRLAQARLALAGASRWPAGWPPTSRTGMTRTGRRSCKRAQSRADRPHRHVRRRQPARVHRGQAGQPAGVQPRPVSVDADIPAPAAPTVYGAAHRSRRASSAKSVPCALATLMNSRPETPEPTRKVDAALLVDPDRAHGPAGGQPADYRGHRRRATTGRTKAPLFTTSAGSQPGALG